MRLFSTYYACKKCIILVEKMRVETKPVVNGKTVYYISGWQEKSRLLNDIAKMEPLREQARKVYISIPLVHADKDNFDIQESSAKKFNTAIDELKISMKTIINLYEKLNLNIPKETEIGFDIKLPRFETLDEFSKCLSDLDFVIRQCPYLQKQDSEIRYGCVDVGSTWLTFLVVGAATTIIINNLSKIVDRAIKIKSHAVTVKMQEEALRSIQTKEEIAAEVLDIFKKTNKVITDQYVAELEKDLGELKDGEEKDKVGRSLNKLAFWMDKGLQIYAAIDSPSEVKDLFPTQDEVSFLSDDIQKLIEMNSQNDN